MSSNKDDKAKMDAANEKKRTAVNVSENLKKSAAILKLTRSSISESGNDDQARLKCQQEMQEGKYMKDDLTRLKHQQEKDGKYQQKMKEGKCQQKKEGKSMEDYSAQGLVSQEQCDAYQNQGQVNSSSEFLAGVGVPAGGYVSAGSALLALRNPEGANRAPALNEDGTPGAWAVEGIGAGNDLSVTYNLPEETPEEVATVASAAATAASAPNENLEEGLAEATPVEETSAHDDLQVAESVDHNVKPRPHPRPWHLLAALAMVLIAVIILVVPLTVFLTRQSSSDPITTDVLSNETLREMERMAVENRILGALDVLGDSASLQSPTSAHSKALEWLLYKDPLMLAADATNLLQRFALALFYFSTTAEAPWAACNPPQDNEGILCYYKGRNGQGIYNEQGIGYTIHTSFYTELLATRWLTGQHECQWGGLFCNSDKMIKSIQLDEMNMTGTFPEEMSLLADLEMISLPLNTLEGPFPPALGRLSKLEYLDIQYNRFTGTVPNSWWGLTNLRHLNLEFNQIDEWAIPPSISQWSNLEYIFLYEASVTAIPTEIFQLTELKFLDLRNNAITGTIPTEVGHLTNLEFLSIPGNQITGTLPSELGLLTEMRELDLVNMGLTGTIPEELYSEDYVLLNALILRGNLFSGTISTSIGKLTTLGYLFLDYNPNLTGTIPSEIGLLRRLGKAVMSGTALTGSMPVEICENRGENFLAILKADCLPLSDDHVPISCPEGCCTKCCSQETGQCETYY